MKEKSCVWSLRKFRAKSEMANPTLSDQFCEKDETIKLALQIKLDDHNPTIASYQTSIISLGGKPPRTTSSLELRLSEWEQ